jgi:hypothetical protein
MIPYVNVDITSAVNFYEGYELTEEDVQFLLDMVDSGKGQEAVDLFIEEFIVPPGIKYQDLMMRYLGFADSGPLKQADENKLTRNVTLLSIALSSLLYSNYKKFIDNAYSIYIFQIANLTNVEAKAAILKEVLSGYEQLIDGAMSQTQNFLLGSIRKLQREMITENIKLKASAITGDLLNSEVLKFKRSLRSKYPEIYKAMESGNILSSRRYGIDAENVRHYKLDYYADMSTRATLLNVDRQTNIISALVAGERAVEFFQSDPRNVQKEREICQRIIHTEVYGESILALDEEAGGVLGVMTVDEAASTPDFSFGLNCRHSLRRLSQDYLDKINKLLEKAA